LNKLNLNTIYAKVKCPKFKGTYKIDGYVIEENYNTITIWISKDTARTFNINDVIILIDKNNI